MSYEAGIEDKTILFKLKLVMEVVMILLSLVAFLVARLTIPEVSEFMQSFGISSTLSFIGSIAFGLLVCFFWVISNFSFSYPFISFSIIFYFFVLTLMNL